MLSADDPKPHINRVFATADSSCYLVGLTKNQSVGRCTKHFILVKHTDIAIRSLAGLQETIPFTSLPLPILIKMERVLGFLPFDATATDRRSSAHGHRSLVTTSIKRDSDLIAFLDQDYWVCTCPITDTTGSEIKKHFFLPRDWINAECLELATVTRDGVFLCPKNGEVAMGIVKGGFRSIWVE